MDSTNRNKLYNRITYLVFACLMIVTMVFPMFSVKTVTGEYSEQTCSSVSALQMIEVGLMGEEALVSEGIEAQAKVDEFKAALVKDGKNAKEINEALLTNADYNKLTLIKVALLDSDALKGEAICLLVTYIALGVLALMFVASIIIRKDMFDMANIFASSAVAVAAILALVLSFTLTVEIVPTQNYVVCSEMIMYVLAIGPAALAVVEAVQFFAARRKKKITEREVIKPFTKEN